MNFKTIFFLILALLTVAFSVESQEGIEGSVPREGFDLFYHEYGSGTPVVILAGGPGFDCDYMLPVASEIAKTNRVILVELRGTGRSIPKSINSETVNLKVYLSDLEALREHLKLDRWILLGHSAGGKLAMQYTSAFPERVDRLVLASSSPVLSRLADPYSDNIMMRLLPEEAEKLRNPQVSRDESVRIALRGTFFDRSKGKTWSNDLNPDTLHGEILKFMVPELVTREGDPLTTLRGFDRPVLVVAGRQDPLDPGIQYETHLVFRNSTLRFIPRCGHFPWIEQPDEFYRIVHEFLSASSVR